MRNAGPSLIRNSPVRGAVMASLIGADDVLHSGVVDCEGDRVGALQDLMLDLALGRVAYGVVVLNRDPERDGRLVVVPWNVMHVDGNGDMRVNARRDWIERAPTMQPELMPTLLDHQSAVLIHAHFGAAPYWERSAQHS